MKQRLWKGNKVLDFMKFGKICLCRRCGTLDYAYGKCQKCGNTEIDEASTDFLMFGNVTRGAIKISENIDYCIK